MGLRKINRRKVWQGGIEKVSRLKRHGLMSPETSAQRTDRCPREINQVLRYLVLALLVQIFGCGTFVEGLKFPGGQTELQPGEDLHKGSKVPNASESNFHHDSSSEKTASPNNMSEAFFWNEGLIRLLKKRLDWQISDDVKTAYMQFVTKVLLHKPPVGIIAFCVSLRLIGTGRIFSVYDQPAVRQGENKNMEDQLFRNQELGTNSNRKYRRREEKEYKGRSLTLDCDDRFYNMYGGIHHVRHRLCWAALVSLYEDEKKSKIQTQSFVDDNNKSPHQSNRMLHSTWNNEFQYEKYLKILWTLTEAMQVTNRPKVARIHFVDEISQPVARLEYQLATLTNESGSKPDILSLLMSFLQDSTTLDAEEQKRLAEVLAAAFITAEVRVFDALLRVCRDRILKTSYRLAKTKEYWNRRVVRMNRNSFLNGLRSRATSIFQDTVSLGRRQEGDRIRLSYAEAAYDSELERLGRVAALLMERPMDMPDSALTMALKTSEIGQAAETKNAGSFACTEETNLADAIKNGDPKSEPLGENHRSNEMGTKGKSESRWEEQSSHGTITNNQVKVLLSKYENNPIESNSIFEKNFNQSHPAEMLKALYPKGWSIPTIPKYSIRWKTIGKGLLSIRRFDNSDGFISGNAAIHVIISTNPVTPQKNAIQPDWMQQSELWIRNARCLLCGIVEETVESSSGSSENFDYSEKDFNLLKRFWCQFDTYASLRKLDQTEYEQVWKDMLSYIEQLPSWRRIGEGREIRLKDQLGLNLLKRFDVFGIPSSLLSIYGAHLLHERAVKPHWAAFRKEATVIIRKFAEIIYTRFWTPLKGIYDDFMNKSQGMMSAFGLEVEEASLDHMLRDLGFGDGTPSTREEALKLATEQYERDLDSGLFSNILRGRLVRLLLIQVQQLKVGTLSALDTIDVLLQGNRIHFQILAAIPAVLILTYGTRYFFRSLYNIRAKDIRPVTSVHGEMTRYLDNIENMLLLSDPMTEEQIAPLEPKNLGDLLLNLHRYLILMDFSTPPFPPSQADQIHRSMQEFLGDGGTLRRLDTERNLKWLRIIQTRHQDLLKSL